MNSCVHIFVRYGENHPVFYIGSLEDALKDSLQCRAREVVMLLFIISPYVSGNILVLGHVSTATVSAETTCAHNN